MGPFLNLVARDGCQHYHKLLINALDITSKPLVTSALLSKLEGARTCQSENYTTNIAILTSLGVRI